MENLKLAFSLLTRIPFKHINLSKTSYSDSMLFFPVCAYFIAFLSLFPIYFSSIFFTLANEISAVLVVLLLALLTGCMHLDGFADLCDGFGCHAEKKERLRIMKDPSVGSFALVGVVILLMLKVVSIYIILEKNSILSIVSIIVFSRFFIVNIAYISKSATKKGMGSQVVGKIRFNTLLFAFILILPCFFTLKLIFIAMCMEVALLILKYKSDKIIGGVTGDVLGACCEITETLGLLILAIIA